MKPNGRRRFRKMNARFRQRGSEVVRERARKTSAGKARKLILNDFWGGDPLPLPPRPFSPRSLVGMSQGARKRAWVAGRLDRMLFPYGVTTDACEMQSDYSWSEIRASRPFLGERLRPCPGCLQCQPKDCDGCGFTLGSGEDCEPCEAHAVERYVYGCDGSGVLPARGK